MKTIRKLLQKPTRRTNTARRLGLEHLDPRVVLSAAPLAAALPADPEPIGPPSGLVLAAEDKPVVIGVLWNIAAEQAVAHPRGVGIPVESDLTGSIPTQPGNLSGNIPTQLGNLSGPGPVFGPQLRGSGEYAKAVDQVFTEHRIGSFFDIFTEVTTDRMTGGDGPMPQTRATANHVGKIMVQHPTEYGQPSFYAYGTLKYGNAQAVDQVLAKDRIPSFFDVWTEIQIDTAAMVPSRDLTGGGGFPILSYGEIAGQCIPGASVLTNA